MALVADFRPLIKLSISNAPNAIVDHAVIRAARKFCDRAKPVRIDIDPVDSAVDTAVYTLVLPAGNEVADVTEVLYDGRKLDPKSSKELSKMDPEYRTTGGTPYFYQYEGSGQLRLVKVPQSAVVGAIQCEVATKPAIGATDVHDELYDEHSEAIADGALAELFRMKAQSWYDPGMAQQKETYFREAADEARVRAGMSRTKGASGKVKYGGL